MPADAAAFPWQVPLRGGHGEVVAPRAAALFLPASPRVQPPLSLQVQRLRLQPLHSGESPGSPLSRGSGSLIRVGGQQHCSPVGDDGVPRANAPRGPHGTWGCSSAPCTHSGPGSCFPPDRSRHFGPRAFFPPFLLIIPLTPQKLGREKKTNSPFPPWPAMNHLLRDRVAF